MLFPVLLIRYLQGRDASQRELGVCAFGICLVAPSLVFFLASNLAVWVFSGMYPANTSGIAACYLQALPFYGYSLAGDLIFIPVLFGCYYAVRAGGPWLVTATRMAAR